MIRKSWRSFSKTLKRTNTDVVIVGGGPVGMVMSSMLNSFGVRNVVLEKSGENPDGRERQIH